MVRRPAVLMAMALLLLVGCSPGRGASDDAGSSATGSAADTTGSTSAASGAPSDVAVCSGSASTAPLTVDVGRQSRVALVHVPAGGGSGRKPVVLVFGGYRDTPTVTEDLTALSAKADSVGFIAVYPSALGDPTKWDVAGNGDITFIRTLLDRLSRESCVDSRRVFATGMSMGAGMANVVGCRLSERIAAIATVSGVYGPNWGDPCRPTRPVPVLAFHGLADPIVPYTGGPIQDPDQGQIADLPPVIAVEAWAARWAAINGCTPKPKPQPVIGQVQPLFWGSCDAPVRLYKIGGGGHTWPGGPSNEPMTNHDISATDVIWDFFAAVQ